MSRQRVTLVRCESCGEHVILGQDPRQMAGWLSWWTVLDEHNVMEVHVCPRCAGHTALVDSAREEYPPQERP